MIEVAPWFGGFWIFLPQAARAGFPEVLPQDSGPGFPAPGFRSGEGFPGSVVQVEDLDTVHRQKAREFRGYAFFIGGGFRHAGKRGSSGSRAPGQPVTPRKRGQLSPMDAHLRRDDKSPSPACGQGQPAPNPVNNILTSTRFSVRIQYITHLSTRGHTPSPGPTASPILRPCPPFAATA